MAEDSYFRVDGADLDSGKETFFVVPAPTSEAAEEAARQKGLLVASVREATPADRQAAEKIGANLSSPQAATASATKSPFFNEPVSGTAPPMKKWFPGTLSNSAPRVPPRAVPRQNVPTQQVNNIVRTLIPPVTKPSPSARASTEATKRPGGLPPTVPKPVKKPGAAARPRTAGAGRMAPPSRAASVPPPMAQPPAPKEIEPAVSDKSEEKPAEALPPREVEPVVAPSPVIPVLDAPTLLELPKEKSAVVAPAAAALGSTLPPPPTPPSQSVEAAPLVEEPHAEEASAKPEPPARPHAFEASPSSGLEAALKLANETAPAHATGSEAALERIASLVAAEVPMPLPQASFAPVRQAEPTPIAHATLAKAAAAPEPAAKLAPTPASAETSARSKGGNSIAVILLAPLAFLSLAGGVFVLAYVLSRAESPDLSDIQKVDLHLQALSQTFLGGMLVLAGLLLFVAAGLVYVGSAIRARRPR